MANETFKAFPGSSYEFLASTWLQQQDLRDKSAVEVADMYYSALSLIREKYAPKTPARSKGRSIRSPGIDV